MICGVAHGAAPSRRVCMLRRDEAFPREEAGHADTTTIDECWRPVGRQAGPGGYRTDAGKIRIHGKKVRSKQCSPSPMSPCRR